MADRRRINGPVGATLPPVYDSPPPLHSKAARPENVIRKIYLETGVTPSASGSAYLELENPNATSPGNTGLKLTCTVHGPRALPRSAPFSPHIILATHVKYAPFATRQRRGYLRDSSERDLGVHLETALRGAIIADRWPKSGVDIIVTIIEGDQDRNAPESRRDYGWDTMNVLAGCITVATAAIADAGIDCVDTVTGGVAALVANDATSPPTIVLDPVVADYHKVNSLAQMSYYTNNMVEKSLVACRHANRVVVMALKKAIATEQEVS